MFREDGRGVVHGRHGFVVDVRVVPDVSAAPAAQRVLALRFELLGVPAAQALLTKLDLVAVCLLTLALDLGVVGLSLAAAAAACADAGE